jgi:hypothetical protein
MAHRMLLILLAAFLGSSRLASGQTYAVEDDLIFFSDNT